MPCLSSQPASVLFLPLLRKPPVVSRRRRRLDRTVISPQRRTELLKTAGSSYRAVPKKSPTELKHVSTLPARRCSLWGCQRSCRNNNGAISYHNYFQCYSHKRNSCDILSPFSGHNHCRYSQQYQYCEDHHPPDQPSDSSNHWGCHMDSRPGDEKLTF
ncbi:hypothetical protein CRENBAI_000099 [Crenichthys baileyi]|uniref:Uncharacterized protein n=1 Tax=Crenichthys baileyi TaxID=28760 RepID=A0AAV9STU5_9TELE